MLDYIVKDFEQARISMNNNTIGGMVVCDSSEQAKMMYEHLSRRNMRTRSVAENLTLTLAEPTATYNAKKKQNSQVTTAAVILHDVGTKNDANS